MTTDWKQIPGGDCQRREFTGRSVHGRSVLSWTRNTERTWAASSALRLG